MAGDTDNPRIWVNADVYTAPLESTEPTDVATDLDAAWDALGLLSEDGATHAREDTVNDHYAWGNILVRTTRSRHKRTLQVTALEDNPVVFDLVNPGSTAETAGGVTTREVVVPQPNRRMFLLETRDGEITRRLVIPQGEVTEVGDITDSDSAMTLYVLTITIYPDADGVLFREISDDPQQAGGS